MVNIYLSTHGSRGYRLQIACRCLTRMVAWQAIAAEQQQLLQTKGLHRLHLEQQVCTLTILA